MGKKQPSTPRSRIKNVLRHAWLCSRERHKALKSSNNCCIRCGIKASTAKGREVKLEVHHEPKINWENVLDIIYERILDVPQFPLCKRCHADIHAKEKENEIR